MVVFEREDFGGEWIKIKVKDDLEWVRDGNVIRQVLVADFPEEMEKEWRKKGFKEFGVFVYEEIWEDVEKKVWEGDEVWIRRNEDGKLEIKKE